MKKIIIGLILVLCGIAYAAAEKSLIIKIEIPAAKKADFMEAFLKAHPNQTTDEKDPVHMTDEQWIQHWTYLQVMGAYKQGVREKFEETEKPVYDPNIAKKVEEKEAEPIR